MIKNRNKVFPGTTNQELLVNYKVDELVYKLTYRTTTSPKDTASDVYALIRDVIDKTEW